MLKVEEGGILSFYASLFHKLVIGNVGKALIASAYASIHASFKRDSVIVWCERVRHAVWASTFAINRARAYHFMQVCFTNLLSLVASELPLAPLTRAYTAFFSKLIESLSAAISSTRFGLAHFL